MCKSAIFSIFCAVIGFVHSIRIIEPNAELKEFKVYWNAPTFQCKSHKVHFEELAEKYDVIQNLNDAFKGEKMTILYDPGNFPALLDKEGTGEVVRRNGGVPQEGDLQNHLTHFRARVLQDIPSENYDGVAVIDFESWRPIFRQNWASLEPYKTLSIQLERERHPFWSDAAIKKEATRRFEKYGKVFMEDTLLLAKMLRPNATWGYYAYPYCFNLVGSNTEARCSSEVQEENNSIMWLFEDSNTLHPSLYLPQNRLNEQQRVQLIEGRIMESQRINKKLDNTKRILPYFWYVYQDSKKFLTQDDLRNSLIVLKSFGIDGMIIWGSSNDVNTKEKCLALYKYFDMVLGPLLLST